MGKEGKRGKERGRGWEKKGVEKYVKELDGRLGDVGIVGEKEVGGKGWGSLDVEKWVKEIGIKE